MNEIKSVMVKLDHYFSEDSYIFDDVFFLPKNTRVKNYHLDLIIKWNIESIKSHGTMQSGEIGAHEESDDNLEDLFDDNEILSEAEEVEPGEIEAEKEEAAIEAESQTPLEMYKKWILTGMKFFQSILNTTSIEKQEVINLLLDIDRFVAANKDRALMFFAEDIEDVPYIYKQAIKTVILSIIIADSFNIQEFAKTNLMIGTLFHDLGMIKIPRTILEKRGQLQPSELAAIRNHTVVGYKYLRQVKYSAIVATGALQHHERIDGKGYPSHVQGEKITQIGRIIAVVDAYCAAIAPHSFKNPLHAKEAVQDLLQKGGSAYDSKILREFIKNISFYPIGSYIVLSDNSPAKVIGTTGVSMRPVVQRLTNGKLEEEIDLSKKINLYIKGVYTPENNQ